MNRLCPYCGKGFSRNKPSLLYLDKRYHFGCYEILTQKKQHRQILQQMHDLKHGGRISL